MYHSSNKSSSCNLWQNKILATATIAGASILISLPILAQSNRSPLLFFQRSAYAVSHVDRGKVRIIEGDLVDNLTSNSDFENLVGKIEQAGLTKQLKEGEFTTVLAPSDKAFNALPDEDYDKLSRPENLSRVLQYHLIQGEVTQEDIDRGEITTLTEEKISISQENNYLKLNNNATVDSSTFTSNGVIIEIDEVLFPPNF